MFQFQNTFINLPAVLYTRIFPFPSPKPHAVIINHKLAQELGLDLKQYSNESLANFFSGSSMLEGSDPIAQAYAGHQFGHFTILGDGRAHLLGEHIKPDGTRIDIQLKGSGRTPYSRGSDGKAVLGPMLREYIISESMHALGIPTTRSLAVVLTGEKVFRKSALPGAILTRIASSHIRVGTFQFASAQQDTELISKLLDYTINRHFPLLQETENKALSLLKNVMERQADLIVHWMRVGFIHGVMNTDNMTLSGETIDYGPCAFMDSYDPNTVFSSIDRTGRYSYENQPIIAQWNLARLAETLLPMIDSDINKAIDLATETVNEFSQLYQEKWLSMMCAKIGIFHVNKDDEKLISDLLEWMHKSNADYTNTFRDLANQDIPLGNHYEDKNFREWHGRWKTRLQQNLKPHKDALCLMKSTNPAVIPRNHRVEQALEDAVQGDFTSFYALRDALKSPYEHDAKFDEFQLPPDSSNRFYQTFCGT